MSHMSRSIPAALLLCAALTAAPGCLFTNTSTPGEDMGSDNNNTSDMSSNNTSPGDMGMVGEDMERDMTPPDPCEGVNEDEACLTVGGEMQRCGVVDINGCEIDCTVKCMDTCDENDICSCLPPDKEDACEAIACGDVEATDSCGAEFTLTCDSTCQENEVCERNTCMPKEEECPTEEQICMLADESCGVVVFNNCGDVDFAQCKAMDALEGSDYCSALTLTLPQDVLGQSKFGEAMAVLGSTLVVSDSSSWAGGLGGSGEVYIYKLEANKNPGPPIKLPHPPGVEAIERFGETLLLVDENTLLVGAPADQTAQTVYVYQRKNNNWVEQTASRLFMPMSLGTRGARFGASMAQNDYTIYIGAPGASNATGGRATGRVFVYELTNPNTTPPEFKPLSQIENPRLTTGFGTSVAPFVADGGGAVFVGAPGRDNVDASQGEVYACIPHKKELMVEYECEEVVIDGADVPRYEGLGSALISNQLTNQTWEAWATAPGQGPDYKQVFHITPGARGGYQMTAYNNMLPAQAGYDLALISSRLYVSGFVPQGKAPVFIVPSVPGSTNMPFFRNVAPIKASGQAEFGRSLGSSSSLLLVGAPGAFSPQKMQQTGLVFAFPDPDLSIP